MVQKDLRKLSQWLWKVFLKWYDEGGENHIKKRFLKLNCFSPLRILTFPLFEETLGAFLFLPPFFTFSLFSIFFSLSFLFLVSWGLGDFDDIWGEKSLLQKLSFQMDWHVMAWSWLWMYGQWTLIREWSYARQYS
jgi:hypothetical protein